MATPFDPYKIRFGGALVHTKEQMDRLVDAQTNALKRIKPEREISKHQVNKKGRLIKKQHRIRNFPRKCKKSI